MAKTIPTKCPSCGGPMAIELLGCTKCETKIHGGFILDRLMSLSQEHLDFCEVFLRCGGSLKDVGQALGISYPTARNRLDDLIATLGYDDTQQESSHLEILEKLTNGELTHAEALELLKKK